MRPPRKPATEELLERPLPHNLEAERSVLGGILVSNSTFTKIAGRLAPEDFYRDAHRRIFAALSRVLERPDGSADFITLKEELSRAGELDAVGGPSYVAALTDGVPRATNVPHYADIVREKAQLRRMIRTADELLVAGYDDNTSVEELLERADREIVKLRHGNGPSRMRSVNAASGELLADLQWRADHRGELIGIDTGFPSINELTNGWQPGELVVVAARPSVGKTTWLLNTAEAAARTGRTVAIFSLEMRRKQLEYRMLSSISGVELSKVVAGYMSDAEWVLVSNALQELCTWRFFIDDTAARTVWDIRSECRRLQADGGVDLVIVDYVQLMAADKPSASGNRNAEITDISRKLKVMADELSVPILLASQLNRASELRSDPRPKLSDLRESGALEQDADTVMFLHRKHHRENGTTQAIFEKQRNGPGGTLNLTVCREIGRFTDGGDDPAPEPAKEKRPQALTRPRR